MALLEVKTSYAAYTDCNIKSRQYQMDGSIAVEIFSRRGGTGCKNYRLPVSPNFSGK